jgi:hypothetical protein
MSAQHRAVENKENDFPRTGKKSTALNDSRVANRDPEKYLFYRVLATRRFYTAKTHLGH